MGLFLDNPVLAKEIRSRFRSRKQAKRNRIATFIGVGTALAFLYYFSITAIMNSAVSSRESVDSIYSGLVVMIELTLLLFLSPAVACSSVTMEREQQTWNALLLSRLSSAEIVIGKYLSALIPSLIVLGVFWPLTTLAALNSTVSAASYWLSQFYLLGVALMYTAIGVFCSWAYRRTFVATAAAFGITAVLVIGTVIVFALVGISQIRSNFEPENFVPMWFNPYMPLYLFLDRYNREYAPGIFHITFSLLATLLLLRVMTIRLARGPKELEQ